jgi:hypothetical protein
MFENRNKMFILSLKSNFNLIIVRPKKIIMKRVRGYIAPSKIWMYPQK